MLWSMNFWKGAAERALKTLVQVLAAAFVVGVPVNAVDIRGALLLAATAVVASLCTSILSADFVAGPPSGDVQPFHVVMDAPDRADPAKKDVTATPGAPRAPAGEVMATESGEKPKLQSYAERRRRERDGA